MPRLLLLLLAATSLAAADPAPAPAPAPTRQFLYLLHLVPRLHQPTGWTADDEAAVVRHYRRLKEGVERGQVILAGKTDEPGDLTFGLVIFEAEDEAAARAYMAADPAVVAGIMTAELRPYRVALLRKS